MLHDQHVLIIRFAYKNQGPRLELVIKPMIAAREINDLSHEVTTINTDSYLESGEINVVKLAPKDTVPELKIYFSNGEYIPAPLYELLLVIDTSISTEDEFEKCIPPPIKDAVLSVTIKYFKFGLEFQQRIPPPIS